MKTSLMRGAHSRTDIEEILPSWVVLFKSFNQPENIYFLNNSGIIPFMWYNIDNIYWIGKNMWLLKTEYIYLAPTFTLI